VVERFAEPRERHRLEPQRGHSAMIAATGRATTSTFSQFRLRIALCTARRVKRCCRQITIKGVRYRVLRLEGGPVVRATCYVATTGDLFGSTGAA
jgi:hypothetical protein